MKALIWSEDALVRDQIRAGTSACPELETVCETGRKALNLLDSRDKESGNEWDWIFLHLPSGQSQILLRSIRERNREAPLVILGDEKDLKVLANAKEQWLIAGALKLPIEPEDFFRTLGRLRKRALAEEKS